MVYNKNEKREYSWEGRNYSVAPSVVGWLLEEIEERDGEVTRESFLAAATPDDSPIHKLFQWDNEKAAHLYRLDQASTIMNSLKVKVTLIKSEEPVKATAFVRVAKDDIGRYNNLHYAFSVPDKRDFILQQAFNELRTFKRKYEIYGELAKVIDAINETIK